MRAAGIAWWAAAASLWSLLQLPGAAGEVNCTLLACPFDCDPATGCYNACSTWNFDVDAAADVYNPTCAARDVSALLCLQLLLWR